MLTIEGATDAVSDLPVEPYPCCVSGCPLLGVVDVTAPLRWCLWHVSRKLNAFDTYARPGLTLGGLMAAYRMRRGIARDVAWMARMTSGFGIRVQEISLQGHDQFGVPEIVQARTITIEFRPAWEASARRSFCLALPEAIADYELVLRALLRNARHAVELGPEWESHTHSAMPSNRM